MTHFVRYTNLDELANMTRLGADVHDKLPNNVALTKFHRRFVDPNAVHRYDASAHKELKFYKLLRLCKTLNIFIHKLTY